MTAVPHLCLPKTAIELLDKISADANQHPGLKLDKLSWAKGQQEQIRAIDAVCGCRGDDEFLETLFARRGMALDACNARRFCGEATGSLTLHLTRGNALENAGLALHPVYGFAWLPGTGLKGMTRAWAETVWKPGEPDQEVAKSRIDDAFGTQDVAGRIVFHDAWPIGWPQLESDIVNSHHSKYYRNGPEKEPPRDREDPVPVYFFTVASGTEFEFALSDRVNAGDGLLEQGVDWMCAALEHAGAGAKTAAGYGRIVPRLSGSCARPVPILSNDGLRHKHRLTLASPAFLAGAKQDQADCDLRPASLRGLLRWWWRTMHAAHLNTGDLAALEALIWGDTRRGGAVTLSLRAESGNAEAELYDRNNIKQASSLPRPKDRKTVQGLFYISYGMNERNSKARWYRRPGDVWNLTLTSRETCWPTNPGNQQPKVEVPAAVVMRQAEASLWLLTRFGGAGSKSRKGFGSLEDISVEGIGHLVDCIAAGSNLRKCCGLESQDDRDAGTPALERRIGPVEIMTPWTDTWFALDRAGAIYQRFVKECKPEDRSVFGLPRKGLPSCGRLASPVHWSLTSGKDKGRVIRLIALPENGSMHKETGDKILRDLAKFAKEEFHKEISWNKGRGSKPQRPGPPESAGLPKSGQYILAELLDRKTRKGGWMAKDMQTGIEGNIENSADVPTDAKPGEEVSLIVRIPNPRNAAFRWPTPESEEQLKRSVVPNRQAVRRRR